MAISQTEKTRLTPTSCLTPTPCITPTPKARKSLENFYSQIYDNPFELCAFYLARELLGAPDTVENCKASLLSVTLEDVVRVAENIELDTEYFLFGSGGKEEDYDE